MTAVYGNGVVAAVVTREIVRYTSMRMPPPESLLHAFHPFGFLGYLFAFGVSCAEAIAFIGFFVPGMTIIVLMGGLAANGVYSFWLLVVVAISGAALGDALSYEFGRVSKRFLQHRPRLWKVVLRAEPVFQSYGWVSIGIGRFTSPVRGILPLVAGIAGMRRRAFSIANIFFASVWGLGSVTVGYLLGNASRSVLHRLEREEWIYLLGVALVLIIIWWLWHKKRKKFVTE